MLKNTVRTLVFIPHEVDPAVWCPLSSERWPERVHPKGKPGVAVEALMGVDDH